MHYGYFFPLLAFYSVFGKGMTFTVREKSFSCGFVVFYYSEQGNDRPIFLDAVQHRAGFMKRCGL